MTKTFSYPEQRVLEDAAFTRGVVPTSIHALAVPVWPVLVEADILDGQDYELIDRFLSRGIAEGGLRTTPELADFFALDGELVDRALRALSAIGHLRFRDNRWELTDLGWRSVTDQKRYVQTRGDRRVLYFDAFGSRPLPKSCYDTKKITYTPVHAVPDRFIALPSFRSFDSGALEALAARPDRDRLNLPERIDRPRQLGVPEQAYLPLYVVENDSRAARPAIDRAREWLGARGLSDRGVAALPSGMVRASLPAKAFGGDGVSLNQVGSFVMQGTNFFQLWCDSREVRQRALLGRVDSMIASRSRVDPDYLRERLSHLTCQFDLGDLTVEGAARLAGKAGRKALAAQLASAARP